MIEFSIDETEEEFKKHDVLLIKVGEEEITFVKKDYVIGMLGRWTNKLLEQGKISIVPGHEKFFEEISNNKINKDGEENF